MKGVGRKERAMWNRVCVVVVVVVLGISAAGAAGQLPAEARLDKYWLQLERRLAFNEFEAALRVMDEILLLQTERGMALTAGFHWQYVQVARSAGDYAAVAAGLQRYLVLAGPSGEHYQEALLMLDDLELRARFDCIFDPRWGDCPPEWRDLRTH